MDTKIETEQPAEVTGTVRMGLGQINNPSPMWAKWVFRIVLYVCSFATVIVTTDKAIPAETALTIVKYLAYVVAGVHGLSKLVGIDISQDANEAKEAFNLKK